MVFKNLSSIVDDSKIVDELKNSKKGRLVSTLEKLKKIRDDNVITKVKELFEEEHTKYIVN